MTARRPFEVAALALVLLASSAEAQPPPDVTPPSVRAARPPRWPEGASADGEVEVRLRLTVGADGRVRAVDLVGRAGPLFDAAALRHAVGLRFEPARRGGEPVSAVVDYVVRFTPPRPAARPVEGAGPEDAAAGGEATGPGVSAADPEEAPLEDAAAGAEARAGSGTSAPTEGPDGSLSVRSDPRGEEREDAAEPGERAAGGGAGPEEEEEEEGAPRYGAATTVDLRVAERPLAAASEQRIEVERLGDVPRVHAEQLLTLAPGVVLANHGGEGKASTLFLRGFDAGEGQDVEVLVEGVPLNEPSNAHQHGYADAHFLIPELVGAVRVLPGPFDPAQGDFALAGTAEYTLGAPREGLTVLGGWGSFRRRRLLLLWGDGERSFAGFEVQGGAGFGANRAHRLVRLLARWGGGDERLGWSVLAGSHALRFDSAGVVREDAVRAGELPCEGGESAQRFCTHDPNQGGSAARHLLVGTVRWARPHRRYVQRAWLQLRRSRFRENFTFALIDERGDGLDEQTDVLAFGLRGDFTSDRVWRGRRQQLELGWLARHDRGDARMWRLRRSTGEPHTVVFDSGLALTRAAAHLSGTLRLPRVTLRAGGRIAAFASTVTDRALPDADRMGERLTSQTADAFGVAVLPRTTLALHLIDAEAAHVDWLSSLGLGARSSDAQALSEGEDAPFARARAVESGLRMRIAHPAFAFEGRAGVFWTRVADDLLFDPEAGRNVPIGATNRFGAFASARLRVTDWAEALASWSWTEAHRPGDDAAPLALRDGPALPFVPRMVGRVDAAFRRALPLRRGALLVGAALGAGVIGRRPLPLGEEAAPYGTVDVSARVGWRFVELRFAVRNLLDAQTRPVELHYESRLDPDDPFGSLRAARHFAAGPPRELFLTLALHLDPAWLAPGDEDEGPASDDEPSDP
ncbi:MAG TPA: TonB family protein [Polyangiaceae bacterium LLY-WYZ-15_(1-7)]|nr:TonB family protein [Polyangiaceae bacterium LLY-WYZ-15_(1-7)]HJL07669.1 TonB family protein [Polyangiaceae bacterium LLY-WYZ-15_(1-7)]HJL38344.1 TonB family protein [Polyangiaceae bacterium LLY-WYZ-15_(1-7)]